MHPTPICRKLCCPQRRLHLSKGLRADAIRRRWRGCHILKPPFIVHTSNTHLPRCDAFCAYKGYIKGTVWVKTNFPLPTWISTVPHQCLLYLSILQKKKKLSKEEYITGLLEATVKGSFLMEIDVSRQASGFEKGCNRLNKKVYYFRQARRDFFETHHESLVRLPWHVSFLTRP